MYALTLFSALTAIFFCYGVHQKSITQKCTRANKGGRVGKRNASRDSKTRLSLLSCRFFPQKKICSCSVDVNGSARQVLISTHPSSFGFLSPRASYYADRRLFACLLACFIVCLLDCYVLACLLACNLALFALSLA